MTILISSFHSLISRNILGTDLLPLLKEAGVRIIIACPAHKQAFFEREFGGPSVTIAPVPIALSRRDTMLRYLALAAVNTKTLRIKRDTELAGRGRFISLLLANALGRAAVRLLNRLATPREPFVALLETHKPSLVFATDIQNEYDVRLIEAARDRGVRVAGMVRSWDNLTAKGLVRAIPSVMIVNNEQLKKEAETIQGISPAIVRVVGIPHYDFYATGTRTPRESFFARIHGDAGKRLALYVPTGDRYLENNTVDAAILELMDKNLPGDFQILVRLPPGDRVRAFEGRANTARIIIDRPSEEFASVKETELSKAVEGHLADTLYYSDIVVSGPSTMAIDAAAFDKPVILVGFDGGEDRPYTKSIRRFYDYDHFAPVLASGGVRYVTTPAAFAEVLAAYVADPTRDHEGRQKVIATECYQLGGSAERLAQTLLGSLA